jgi:RNA polymerase sigma factor (sigma-70 family)
MNSNPDLLSKFVSDCSESAFRELVDRHIDMVFGVAFRRLGGDFHLAKDATQEVFSAFAQKAPTLKPNCLSGWLHQHACFVTANIIRSEQRRKARELTANDMNASQSKEHDSWSAVLPELDEAIESLPVEEREIILLRYFSKQNFQTIGKSLAISEDAAQKRVSRILDKLRSHFSSRGIALANAGIAALLTAQGLSAAPAGFTAVVATSAITATKITTSSATIFQLFAMSPIKLASIGTVCLMAVVAPLIMQHQSNQRLRTENLRLRKELAAFAPPPSAVAKSDSPTNQMASTKFQPDTELLRLRGQVGLLKADLASRTNLPRRLRVLSPEEFENFQPTMDSDEARQILTFDSLRDVGIDSPEAAVETYAWAARQAMNTNTFAQAQKRVKEVVFIPPGATYGGFAPGGSHDPIREDNNFLKIEAVTFPTPDTATIYVQGYDHSGQRNGWRYTLVRTPDGWKVDIGLHPAVP